MKLGWNVSSLLGFRSRALSAGVSVMALNAEVIERYRAD